jgi:hypothetical protein
MAEFAILKKKFPSYKKPFENTNGISLKSIGSKKKYKASRICCKINKELYKSCDHLSPTTMTSSNALVRN